MTAVRSVDQHQHFAVLLHLGLQIGEHGLGAEQHLLLPDLVQTRVGNRLGISLSWSIPNGVALGHFRLLKGCPGRNQRAMRALTSHTASQQADRRIAKWAARHRLNQGKDSL